jgi:hypothetical protein
MFKAVISVLLGVILVASIATGYLYYDANRDLCPEQCIGLLHCAVLFLVSLFLLIEIFRLSSGKKTLLLRRRKGSREPGFFSGVFLVGTILFSAVLLAHLLWMNFMPVRSTGCFTSCKSNFKNIGTAMEMYSENNGGRYPPSLSYITPNYLRTIPTCPSAGMQTYMYINRSDPDIYTVWCSGASHKGMFAPGFPQYDAIQGLIDH